MGKKLKIGLVFSYSEDWIGGTYYILNLIRSLETLEKDKAPDLFLIHSKPEEYEYVKTNTNYSRLHPLKVRTTPWYGTFLLRVCRKVFGIEPQQRVLRDSGFDLLFPVPKARYFSRIKNGASWIPDFQEIYFPQFFSPLELEGRKFDQNLIVESGRTVVFSSSSARKDFLRLYPQAKNPTFILPFAVSHPKLDFSTISEVQARYEISGSYYFCANQFWVHKNHAVILEALKESRKQGHLVQVVFSGKQEDHRNPQYFQTIKQYVKDHGLGGSVKFLGFIDRSDQLLLMRGSLAVIQPSLFEGWSTVVEDCKSLGTPLILSRIPVHEEQNPTDSVFFDPNSPLDLMKKLIDSESLLVRGGTNLYGASVENFAQEFLKIATFVSRQSKKVSGNREKDV